MMIRNSQSSHFITLRQILFSTMMIACFWTLLLQSLCAEEKEEELPSVANLILQLGHADFEQREIATKKILDRGIETLEPLRGAINNPNPEIRFRSRRLVKVIEKQDMNVRMKKFSESKDLSATFGLPGSKKFLDLVGYTSETRKLYVAMLQAEPGLLIDYERNSKNLATNYQQRIQYCQRCLSRGSIPTGLGSCATFLMLAQSKTVGDNPVVASGLYSVCVNRNSGMSVAVASGPHSKALKKLFGEWFKTGPSGYQVLRLANQFQIKEGVIVARKDISNPGMNTTPYPGLAYYIISKFGDDSDISMLEQKLTSTKVVYKSTDSRTKKTIQTHESDLALLTLVLLKKQKYSDYGFSSSSVSSSSSGFNVRYAGLTDQAEREKRLKKWQEYSKSLPKDKAGQTEEPEKKGE